jgi:hypothetical protein
MIDVVVFGNRWSSRRACHVRCLSALDGIRNLGVRVIPTQSTPLKYTTQKNMRNGCTPKFSMKSCNCLGRASLPVSCPTINYLLYCTGTKDPVILKHSGDEESI